MDQSPWKGDCILVPWVGTSNRSQSDLAAEGVSLSFPSHQLQRFSSRSGAGSTRCAVGRDLPSLRRNKKEQGTFLVLVSSGCEGMRGGLQVVCGQRVGGVRRCGRAGCLSPMSHQSAGAHRQHPLPLTARIQSVHDAATIRDRDLRALSHFLKVYWNCLRNEYFVNDKG